MTEHFTHDVDDARRRADIARLLLDRSGLTFTANGLALEFRGNDRPACDFYPATGRWRVRRGGRFKYFRGGPVAFINWYNRQQESTEHEHGATGSYRAMGRAERPDCAV